MSNLALTPVHIAMVDTLVDNGKNGYFNKSWYENRYGLKDINDNWVVSPIYSDIYKSEDMFTAIYKSKQGKKILFFDKYGTLKNNPKLEIIDAKEFKDGCCLVQIAIPDAIDKSVPWTYVINLCKWGLIDKHGNLVAKPVFDYENEVQIQNKKQLIGLIKENGCGVLKFASPKSMLNKLDINVYKKAIKYYLLKEYVKHRDKDLLKKQCAQQNSLFKKIRKDKLKENLLNIKRIYNEYELER